MKFAIDLLWVRHNRVGGTESYVRNLLKGFMMLNEDFQIFLVVSEDNQNSFEEFYKDNRFNKILCNIKSEKIVYRIIWENFNLSRILKNNNINICFEPVYSKPILAFPSIKFITTIHDLQAWHYPEYQSKIRVLWLKLNWKNSVKTSRKVIAISDFVRNDIVERYGYPNKVITIHNPIIIDKSEITSLSDIIKKYDISNNEFYYTVSSLLPHKNLKTLIEVMRIITEDNIELPKKLLISGISGKDREYLVSLIEKYKLSNNIVLTGFVNDDERNALFKYCRAFLFPSIFEGFGMPPVEAMAFGSRVITTKETSLYEVTQGKAIYIKNPFDYYEWISAMIHDDQKYKSIDIDLYDAKNIAKKYLDCFSQIN